MSFAYLYSDASVARKAGPTCARQIPRWVALGIGLAILGRNDAYAVPQKPLAKGRIEAILPVIRAAYNCGITAVRVETDSDGLARLYADTDDSYPFPKLKCAEAWVSKNAAKFNLQSGY